MKKKRINMGIKVTLLMPGEQYEPESPCVIVVPLGNLDELRRRWQRVHSFEVSSISSIAAAAAVAHIKGTKMPIGG